MKRLHKTVRKHLPALTTLSLIGLVGMPVFAQSRQERVDKIATMLAGATAQDNEVYTDAETGEVIRATPRQLMRETLTAVDFKDMPAKLALEIWSDQTQVPLIVNWASLKFANVDPDTPINLNLKRVPAEVVLKLIVQQMQPEAFGEDELILDVEQWFVRIMTKRDALRQSTTKIYFIGDLLMTVPNFDNAPGFDLNDALSNTNSGGSGQGTGGGNNGGEKNLWKDDDKDKAEREPTKAEKAERIADMIRNTIEPDIWRANGGEYASVRYLRGMLVVKAPDFVHEQIGVPFGGSTTRSAKRSGESRYRSGNDNNQGKSAKPVGSSGNVAGVAPSGPKLSR